MKILSFVDMHGSLKALKKLEEKVKKENPDVIICAGDMSIFEQNLDYIMHKISKFKKPILVVHGNHEGDASLKKSCSLFENLTFIHGRTYEFNNVLFIGWGGGGFSTKDKELERKIRDFKKKMKDFEKVVLVTHAPPYNTKIDKIMEESCGSKTIRNFIIDNTKKIKIAISGHLHENADKEDKIKETRVVNPGPYGKVMTI